MQDGADLLRLLVSVFVLHLARVVSGGEHGDDAGGVGRRPELRRRRRRGVARRALGRRRPPRAGGALHEAHVVRKRLRTREGLASVFNAAAKSCFNQSRTLLLGRRSQSSERRDTGGALPCARDGGRRDLKTLFRLWRCQEAPATPARALRKLRYFRPPTPAARHGQIWHRRRRTAMPLVLLLTRCAG